MRAPIFDEKHPVWNLFIEFHLGQYSGSNRAVAKAMLFPIHYGAMDLTYAFAEVTRLREEKK